MWVCGLDWVGPGLGQVAYACECGNKTSGSIKFGNFLSSCKPVSFSRRILHHGIGIMLFSRIQTCGGKGLQTFPAYWTSIKPKNLQYI